MIRIPSMIAKDVPKALLEGLNEASRGRLYEIRDLCEVKAWDLDLSCVTFLNGLPGTEMRLCVSAFHEARTMLFIEAKLEGAVRVLGWNLYLAEKVARARKHIDVANRRIDGSAG